LPFLHGLPVVPALQRVHTPLMQASLGSPQSLAAVHGQSDGAQLAATQTA
jgi:hypothetical protein